MKCPLCPAVCGRSQIEFEGRKVSGAGSLFLLLLNEKDESSAGAAGLSGKDRLQQAWEYHIGASNYSCYIFSVQLSLFAF